MMNDDYKKGYKDGFLDGFEAGKEDASKGNPIRDLPHTGIKKPLPMPDPRPKKLQPVIPKFEWTCPICGVSLANVSLYACLRSDCPNKVQYTTSQNYVDTSSDDPNKNWDRGPKYIPGLSVKT